MASLNQNFTKFQKDTFQIKFTITDAEVSLSNYEAWWGCWVGSSGELTPQDYPGDATAPVDTPIVEKATTGWTTGAAGGAGEIVMATTSVTVYLTQDDFFGNGIASSLITEGQYYHELVLGNNSNGSDSVVAATGIMTISPSLFTNNEYRWV